MTLAIPAPAWTAAGWTILHLSWIGGLIGLAASIARRLMRRSSPEARHAVALLGLVLLAVSPCLTFARLYQPIPAGGSTVAAPAALEPGGLVDLVADAPARLVVPMVLGSSPGRPDRLAWLRPWVDALPWAWLAGSSLTLGWLALGLVGIATLRRRSVRLTSGPIAERCRELARSLGLAREVALAVSDRVAAPLLIGLARPTILLPASAVTGWPVELIELALIHELAHLRRFDHWICLFQAIVEALMFFHPTTWWLSSWLRLERETCCDRIVVERTGRPRVYAEWLAAIAGARPLALAPSFTERPIATRIRRILLKEDRPMSLKPTAPEALALAFAGLLAASMVLPTLAVQAPPTEDKKTEDLRRLAALIADEPVSKLHPDDPRRTDYRIRNLLYVTQAQAAQGDRSGAWKTLESVERMLPPVGEDPWSGDSGSDVDCRSMMAAIHYDLGDAEGGRKLYREILKRFDSLDPARRANRIRAGERALRAAARYLATDEEEVWLESKQAQGPDSEFDAIPEEVLWVFAQALASHREPELLRGLVAHGLALCESAEPSYAQVAVYDHLGRALVAAGDPATGRPLIAKARALLDQLPDHDSKTGLLLLLAMSEPMTDLDDLEGRLRAVPAVARNRAIWRIIERLNGVPVPDSSSAGGIRINIAAPRLSLRESARDGAVLSRLVVVAETLTNPKERARTLAVLARLQAQTRDGAVALMTAESIPNLRRTDDPGTRDGFADAVKPVTIAMIAGELAKRGDQANAGGAFAWSRELAQNTADEAERMVSWIVLARELQKVGRADDVKAILADVIPAARTQPEPRRSRMLGTLAEVQLQVAGADEASKTVESLADRSGVEKAAALFGIARRLKDSGQAEAARPIARRALELLEPQGPEPEFNPKDWGRLIDNGFFDYDQPTPGLLLAVWRPELKSSLAVIAGTVVTDSDPEKAQYDRVMEARRTGGLGAAVQAVEAIESPGARDGALRALIADIAIAQERK